MADSNNQKSSHTLTAGIVGGSLGLAIGVVVGVLVWSAASSRNELPFEIPVNASATHGHESYALASGLLENDVEAIFFLDALTGSLKGAAMNIRSHKFQAFFARNILQDFGEEKLKNPKFLMVTGRADLQRSGAKTRLGQSVVYVMELTTGKCVAYAVPAYQNRSTAQNQSFSGPLGRMDIVPFRQVKVREQATRKGAG